MSAFKSEKVKFKDSRSSAWIEAMSKLADNHVLSNQ